MKKLSALLLGSAILLSPLVEASAQAQPSTITVYIDGQLQSLEQSPIIDRDFTLVPLRGTFEQLGAKVEWDGTTNKITATKDSTRIIMTIGSNSAFKNGAPVKLDVSPKIINGRTMVPLRFVSEALGSEVQWDGANKRIEISNKRLEDNILTFDQAIALAEKNSPSLKKAMVEIDRSDEVRENAADNVNYTPVGTGNGSDDAKARSAVNGLQQADVSLQMAKKNIDTLTDKIHYNVRKAYDEVLQKNKDLQLAELSLNNVRTQEHLASVKAENGIVSSFDLIKAQNSTKEAIEKLEVSKKSLEDALQKFNALLGFDGNKEYELIDSPSFQQLQEVDVEDYVKKMLADNPTIWTLEKQIDLTQLEVDLYAFNTDSGGQSSYKAKELEVTKAKLSLSETKQSLEQSVKTMYYNIRQQESQLGVLQANLAKAEQGLAVVQAKFDVGMAIEAELAEAVLSVEQLKKQIFDVTVQHEQLKMAFEKPWVLTGN